MFNKGFYPSPEPVIELLMQAMLAKREYEIVSLGQCFAAAERKANVEVALVKVAAQERPAQFTFE